MRIAVTVAPIRSHAELAQAHLRLDEQVAANACDLPIQDVRDEFEVLTALICYYEQRTQKPKEFEA